MITKNKKQCPHCGDWYRTGAIFPRHENACARRHGVDPTTELVGPGGSAAKKEDPPEPRLSQWVMWNRGTYRGWGFGRVSKLTPRIVKLETPHLGTIQWERSDFQEDIQEGRVFFIDLDQIIRALMEQLARLEDTYTSEQDKERAYLVEETQERLGQALFLLEKLKNLGC